MGTYLGVDGTRFKSFQMDVHGSGPKSGTLKIELVDDDNGNWEVEQDPKKSYAPIYDDKFIYEIHVDWDGWKRVTIPITEFKDDNPGVGDDIWNPSQTNGSGGLLTVQIIAIGSGKTGALDAWFDNVKFLAGPTANDRKGTLKH